jgi:hypothetical protein
MQQDLQSKSSFHSQLIQLAKPVQIWAARLSKPEAAGFWANRFAWIFCLVACSCHIMSLPLFVTFDSQWYIRLAEILGTSHFPVEWDFLRTPLYPAMLRLAFWLLGRQAMAVFALHTCLACSGIWFLSRTLRDQNLQAEAAIGIAVLSAFPTFVAYQHVLMTEVGSFMFLALIVSLLARPEPCSLKGGFWIAFAVGVSYYYRSSFLYLAPLLAILYVLKGLREPRQEKFSLASFGRRAAPQFAVVALVPFLLAYPWQRRPEVSIRNGQSVLLYGLVKQGVLPLTDPILGAAAPLYAKSIEDSKVNGVLPNNGLTNGREYAVIGAIWSYGSAASSIFIRSVRSNPAGYLQAVFRNVVVFSGFGDSTYDNADYRRMILYMNGRVDPGPSWIAPLGDEFRRTTPPSFTERLLRKISPLYDWLVRLGLIATVLAFFIGLWRLDHVILAFTAPVLAFMAMHALLLLSQDRMVLPAQPILLLNLILVPAWLKRGFQHRIPQR